MVGVNKQDNPFSRAKRRKSSSASTTAAKNLSGSAGASSMENSTGGRRKLSGIKNAERVRGAYPVVDTEWISKGDKIIVRFLGNFRDDDGGPRPLEARGTVTHVDGNWVNLRDGSTSNFCYKPWIFEVSKS